MDMDLLRNRLGYSYLIVLFIGATFFFAGCDCSTDTAGPSHQDCSSTDECPGDQECVEGVCRDSSNAAAGADVGFDTDPGADGDAGGEPGDGGTPSGDTGGDPDDAGEAPSDAGGDADFDPECPNPLTCEEQSIECGPATNGCGGTIYCGGCPSGQICDTSDARGSCVESQCTSAISCADEGVECGSIPDGCGGTQHCGTCDDGEVCGSGDEKGVCLEQGCTPITCSDSSAECGVIADGCGGFIQCGSCDDGQVCGSGDERGECIDLACSPMNCDDHNPGDCGPHPDGCGGTIDCGMCSGGQLCGTGPNLGECVEPSCIPLTCDDYDDVNCGPVSDGCGGVTDSCGDCQDPEICGGGGLPNVCGADAQDGCDGLCEDQAICAGGDATTLTGTVTAPNGDLPIPNAVVYVPNVPLDDLPPIEPATECIQCEDEELGDPLVGTITEYDGTFELRHVPAGVDFPLVIKIGQWRRVVNISPKDACQTHALDNDTIRLPRSQQEQNEHDNIPQTAISTGAVDAIECVLHKLGVETSEFTRHNQDGRIHIYRANGGVADQQLANACDDVECDGCFLGACWGCGCDSNKCTDRDPGSCGSSSGGAMLQENLSSNLYGDQATLDSYDMVVMDCEANDHSASRSTGDLERIRNYVNGGGRLFASHYAYDWLHETDELRETAIWGGGEDFNNDSLAFVDDTFPGGSVFWDWLQLVDADHGTTGPGGEPQIAIEDPRTYVVDVNDGLATRWVYTEAGAPGHVNRNSIQQYTFDTPVFADESEQCGQVAYSAFHVTGVGTSGGPAFPDYCSGGDLTPQEKVLAYMLFDLAACVSEDGEPPPPECTPLDCNDMGAECGLISDGCGETLDCGECPDGTACGGGGEPNICGGGCEPLSCDDHGADCGIVSDGCGGTVDCGECPDGLACGGDGSPNLCGCTPMNCDDHNAECGEVSDGCGNTLDCGECPDGTSCGGGGTANICGAECEPLSCDDHDAECGSADDGCGGTLDCGECPEPLFCGGDGEANICGCSPLTCDDHNAECGVVSDGCGDIIDCGECPEGMECDQLQCVPTACLPAGAPCTHGDQCCSDTCAIDSSEAEGECIAN